MRESGSIVGSQVRLDQMVASIRQCGHRITPQRVAVLKILVDSTDHPSAEQMFERVRVDFPMTSLATVYKTISLLKKVGEVLELGFSDDSNHYDGRKPFPHPHLICVQCRHIGDAEGDDLDRLARQVNRSTGYEIRSHRLDFFGVCPACQEQDPCSL